MNLSSKVDVQCFLQQVFSAMFDPAVSVRGVGQFFSKDYCQIVDGKRMNFDEFNNHIQTVKDSIGSAFVTFEKLVVDGSSVADIHTVHGLKKDGAPFKTRVMAFYNIENGKIRRTEEFTHLIEGSPRDRDLGSRTN